MREETTDWNDANYASAKDFVCASSGLKLAIGANQPQNVRAMELEVAQGNYSYEPDTLAGGNDITPSANTTVTVTATLSALPVAGAMIRASSSDPTKGTIAPLAKTNASGQAVFAVTKVAAGATTLSFACGDATDTVLCTFS